MIIMAASDESELDTESLYKSAADLINREFEDKIELLNKVGDLYSKYKSQQDEIEQKLKVLNHEIPIQLGSALTETDRIMGRLEEIQNTQQDLRRKVSSHLLRVESMVADLRQPIKEVLHIQCYINYLQWIQYIQDISSQIQTALLVKADQRAVLCFCSLVKVGNLLFCSQCSNLVRFVTVTIEFWHNLLKKKFTREFEENLKLLKWPFLLPMSVESIGKPDPEIYAKFEAVFINLLHLQLPSKISDSRKTALTEAEITFSPLLPPLYLLVQPLRKRFIYHFYGYKETNNLEKPEWYFTEVLKWIREHSAFLETVIQPILDKEGYEHLDAKVEFMRGLVQLVMEKLNSGIEKILYDDVLLSHTIDETLSFDRELRINGFLPGLPCCLQILTQDQCFTRWINMERRAAVEKMDTMLSSPSAWKPRYQEHSDIDEHRVPECGENFVTLIQTVTDRYKPLPHPGHRLQFLDLQLELMDDFRLRLQQLHKEEAREPLESHYCAILNTVNYIIFVLMEWSDFPFFLQMLYYKFQYQSIQSTLQQQKLNCTSPNLLNEVNFSYAKENIPVRRTISVEEGLHLIAVQKEALDSLQEDFDEAKLDNISGTIFDKILELMEHMKDDMLRKLAEYVVLEVKAKSRSYRKDKWFALPPQKDFINMSLSPTACSMLMILKTQLYKLQESLAQSLFNKLWQLVAEELNQFLYRELILQNRFNEGGCVQLNFDMTRNLFPIFGEFSQRPENYFKDVKEACALLVLPRGAALLLRDTLQSSQSMNGYSPATSPDQALAEQGVFKLKHTDALVILNLRTDLNIL